MGFFSLITIHFPHHQSDRFDSYTIFVANAAWRIFSWGRFCQTLRRYCLFIYWALSDTGWPYRYIYTGLCRVTLSENFDLGLGPAWDFTLGFFCINSMHQHHSPRSPPISPSSSIRTMIIIMIVIRKGSEIWFWESLPHCRLLPGKALERENCQLLIIVIVKVNTVSYKVSTYSKLTWCFRI